jgi:hypothetical protein
MPEIPWSEVGPGDVLALKGGAEWSVLRVLGSEITVANAAGDEFTKARPSGTVTRLFTPQQAMDIAEATLGIHLGATLFARQRPDGSWTVPLDYPEPGSLLAHLRVFHAVTTWEGIDTNSLTAVTRQHVARHGLAALEGWTPHVHDPAVRLL